MTNLEPIKIPDRFARGMKRGIFYGRLQNDEVNEMQQPILEGLATQYLKPFILDGSISILWQGAFTDSLASGRPIGFCLDHDTGNIFATTHDCLELWEDHVGLTFRLDLRRVENGPILGRMASVGDRACMSISYEPLKKEIRKFGKHDVVVVLAAKLLEISLCRVGKVSSAFAFVNDASRPKPENGHRDTVFKIAKITHGLRQTSKAMTENQINFSARLDKIERHL
jgi:HK97 family phage prohead protease